MAGGYLAERISVASQRGNADAASPMGTLPLGTNLEPVLYLYCYINNCTVWE
jgi:hypothetical protein